MQSKNDVLKECTVHGFVVALPPIQLERKLYQDTAKSLELIGGKWNRKANGFVFEQDPSNLLADLQGGKNKNIKKEFQFFATSSKLSNEMVSYANIEEYDLILEPSAGQGAIIKAIQSKYPKHLVHYCELMELNRSFLSKLTNVQYLTDNFLTLSKIPLMTGIFDKIIANPPFSKSQDIAHINQMWKCLKPGGRIVTIASNHWKFSSNKKEINFKKWLNSINADIIDVPAGEFKESGTNISTCMLIIDKTK